MNDVVRMDEENSVAASTEGNGTGEGDDNDDVGASLDADESDDGDKRGDVGASLDDNNRRRRQTRRFLG